MEDEWRRTIRGLWMERGGCEKMIEEKRGGGVGKRGRNSRRTRRRGVEDKKEEELEERWRGSSEGRSKTRRWMVYF